MTRELAAVIMLAALALLLVLVWRGWRSRVGRYRDLPDMLPATALTGHPEKLFVLFYVATTEAGKPLDRVARSPLAFRAKTTLGTSPEGIVLQIPGESDVAISSNQLRGVGRATWTIDRVVDSDGLIFLRWRWGPLDVDSYFRSVDYPADDVVAAIESALPDTAQEDV